MKVCESGCPTNRPSRAAASSRRTPCRTPLLLDGRLLLGPARGGLLGLGAIVGQLAARVLQVGADEPLKLLQLGRMFDEHVLGDQVEIFEPVDRLASVL